MSMLMTLLIALGLPTTVAALLVSIPGMAAKTWVRGVFLVLINLNPWTVGTWRHEFSKRETFMAAWFVAFVLALLGLAFGPRLLGHIRLSGGG